ncbi:MAG: peptide chain release factor 2 [Sedimentisphaerales bacterium]|nr:peptide chain release factor 2 [Sedimentisphaerales bacterium]
MELAELKSLLLRLSARVEKIGTGFDLPNKKHCLEKLEKQMSEPDFWDKPDLAQSVVSQLSALKSLVVPAEKLKNNVEDTVELFELAQAESDEQMLAQIETDLAGMTRQCEEIELQGLLSGPDDTKNCFFSIHAGAGGTESCDWATMLLRMYTRYFETNKYKFKELEVTPGEEAGIRSVTLRVSGAFAFGKLSCETGVHRLVRISPFDSQSRRHTSFAAVDCIPEFDEDIGVEIKDDDLRMDFYRASGAGGQHVNKVSSAVRITHRPTGIVVQCQNERSQHKNRAQALKVLRARLYILEQNKRDEQLAKMYDSKGQIAWGNQIRSYVMQPYQMVKDHRTAFETGNVDSVLDGKLDGFIESYLRYRSKKKNKQQLVDVKNSPKGNKKKKG